MRGIFISYRRDDSSGYTIPLFDRLVQRFGTESVFKDIDTIQFGMDFIEEIERAVMKCDVFIVVIGRYWLNAKDVEGRRRLDNEGDFVRVEIETALKRNIRVIPALVGGATMPKAEALPKALANLTRRQAIELSDLHFHSDLDRLIHTLESLLPFKANDITQDREETQERIVLQRTEAIKANLVNVGKRSRILRVFLEDQVYTVKFEHHFWTWSIPFHLSMNGNKIYEGDSINVVNAIGIIMRHIDFHMSSAAKVYLAKITFVADTRPIKAFRLEIDEKMVYNEGF